jgi:hypothetical protein
MATQTSGEATGSDGSFITGDDIGAKEKMVAGREAFQGPSIGPSDPEKDIQAVPMGEDTMTAVEPDPGLVCCSPHCMIRLSANSDFWTGDMGVRK